MRIIGLLADMLGGQTGRLIRENAAELTELRLRIGKPACLRLLSGICILGEHVSRQSFASLMNRLMENSLYAREHELRYGYFTAYDGCRVGVCGHVGAGGEAVQSLSGIGSACIRIPREIPGCADALVKRMLNVRPESMLLISPPGMGKTTMLRDLVRQVSNAGFQVALVDERREIAACQEGIPQLDVGISTDVMDGMEKSRAIPMLLRACAPDLIAVDELGNEADTRAVMDAVRCGTAVAASVHAAGIRDAMQRTVIGELIRASIFRHCAVLGPVHGSINSIYINMDGNLQTERIQDAESFIAGDHTVKLYRGGKGCERAPQAAQ